MLLELLRESHARLGFSFALVVVTIAWNLDWRHYSRYWLRVPSPRLFKRESALRVKRESALRGFFLVSAIASIFGLIVDLVHNPLSLSMIGYSLIDGLLIVGFLAFIDIAVRLVLGKPRDRSVNEHHR